jgi:enhancing lycopene biosynthesis protein 2
MSKKIAIVLSGCGVKDGSEIHESVLAILATVRAGAEPVFYAPDVMQTQVVNHATGDMISESRNVLSEAARIARGDIQALDNLKASDVDALVFPGGFGAALNLCNFAQKGADCDVHPEVSRVVQEFRDANKPMGFICIAPSIAAKVLGKDGVQVTIGTDAGTAEAIEKTGATHIAKAVHEIHVDENLRVVSTPAYMLGQNIAEIEQGISKLVEQVISMC